jgi:hypothetical protein
MGSSVQPNCASAALGTSSAAGLPRQTRNQVDPATGRRGAPVAFDPFYKSYLRLGRVLAQLIIVG